MSLAARDSTDVEENNDSVRRCLDSQFISMEESRIEKMCRVDNLKVYARVRPLMPEEERDGNSVSVMVVDEITVRAIAPHDSKKFKNATQYHEDFTYTQAFGDVGQFQFFEKTMKEPLQNFIEGQNSLIFSYGVTGSGKTFTLQGDVNNPGIVPLSLKLYFSSIEDLLFPDVRYKPYMFADVVELSEDEKNLEIRKKTKLLALAEQETSSSSTNSIAHVLYNYFSDKYVCEERQTTLPPEELAAAAAAHSMKEMGKKCVSEVIPGKYSIWVSFLEIYNEGIFDLLMPMVTQRPSLNLGADKNGDVYVKGLREINVSSSEEALKLLQVGRRNLNMASTKLNYQSSRSHCIFSLKVVKIVDADSGDIRVNRLSFCDLAGSERSAKAQTSGLRLKEASNINTSLLVLGRCLDQMRLPQSQKDKMVLPIRESKLTRLISGFFMGIGKAAMIINASPSSLTFDETLHVLKFSAIAKQVMINDSYLSATLHNLTSKWGDRLSMSCNESLVSEDEEIWSNEAVEEIIELARGLEARLNEEIKEKVELEWKIRKEVVAEVSAYSDKLLDEARTYYREEQKSIKASYEKRMDVMKKRHEVELAGLRAEYNENSEYETTLETSDIEGSDKVEKTGSSKESAEGSSEKSFHKLDQNDAVGEKHDEQNKVNSLLQELEGRDLTILDLHSQIEELKKTIETLQTKSEDTKNEFSVAESLSKTLKTQFAVAKEENTELAEEKSTLMAQIDSLTATVAGQQGSVQELEEAHKLIANMKINNDEFQTKLAAAEQLYAEMKQKHDGEKCINMELQAFSSNLEDELSKVNEMKAALEEKMATLGKDNNDKDTIESLEAELAESKNEIESLRKILADVNAEFENLQKEKSQKNEEKDRKFTEYEARINTLRDNLEAYESKVADLEDKAKESDNIVSILHEKVCDTKGINQKLQSELENITLLLSDEKIKSDSLRKQVSELENVVENYKLENSSLQTKMVSELQSEGDKVKVQLLENELLEAKNEVESLHNTIACRTVEIENLQKELSSTELFLQQEQEIMELNEKSDSLTQTNEILEEKVVSYEASLEEKASLYEALKEKFASYEVLEAKVASYEALEAKVASYEALEAKVASYDAKMNVLMDNLECGISEIAELKHKLKDAEYRVARLNEKISYTENEEMQVSAEIIETSRRLSIGKEQSTELSQYVTDYGEGVLKLQKALEFHKVVADLTLKNFHSMESEMKQTLDKLREAELFFSEERCVSGELKFRMDNLVKENEKLKRENSALQLEAKSLPSDELDLNNKVTEMYELQREIAEAKKHLEEEKSVSENLRTVSMKLEEEMKELQEEKTTLQSKFDSMMELHAEQKAEWEDNLEKREIFEQELEKLGNTISAQNETIHKLLSEKVDDEAKLKDLTQQLEDDTSVSGACDLKTENEDLAKMLQDSEKGLSEEKDITAQLQKDLETVKTENSALLNQIQELTALREESEKRRDSIQNSFIKVRQDNKYTTTEVARLTQLLNVAKEENLKTENDLAKMLQDSEKSLSEEKDITAQLQKDLETVKTENSALLNEIQELTALREETEKRRDSFQNSFIKVRQDNKDTTTEVARLTQLLNVAEEENLSLKHLLAEKDVVENKRATLAVKQKKPEVVELESSLDETVPADEESTSSEGIFKIPEPTVARRVKGRPLRQQQKKSVSDDDEDFEPTGAKKKKKGQTAQVRRSARRKAEEEAENVSPLKKFTQRVGVQNVKSYLGSPSVSAVDIVTPPSNKKRLFNPDKQRVEETKTDGTKMKRSTRTRF